MDFAILRAGRCAVPSHPAPRKGWRRETFLWRWLLGTLFFVVSVLSALCWLMPGTTRLCAAGMAATAASLPVVSQGRTAFIRNSIALTKRQLIMVLEVENVLLNFLNGLEMASVTLLLMVPITTRTRAIGIWVTAVQSWILSESDRAVTRAFRRPAQPNALITPKLPMARHPRLNVQILVGAKHSILEASATVYATTMLIRTLKPGRSNRSMLLLQGYVPSICCGSIIANLYRLCHCVCIRYYCGWDLGDCCASAGNGICENKFGQNSLSCGWDHGDCCVETCSTPTALIFGWECSYFSCSDPEFSGMFAALREHC